ncbi:DEAD/DEAH box helicase family protein [Thermogemmatispora carboxidivorans]|uniref:type I restriction endonuclease subunit R n=1 Tax=Thermogemmatispora carboxidivorans TaxID=1382306 RepID=UPI000A435030|nr:DEAD/DEAH box helicase family protein [Thermogemmatispora carboxidivorans]
MLKPEQEARQQIDELLRQAGWAVQVKATLNLGAARGVALCEASLKTGDADYLLFVDRKAVGIIEAKKVGTTLTGVEEQSSKYRHGVPADLPAARLPLPFVYESTGVETRFTNYLEPAASSRQVFAFHRPETLATWLEQAPEGVPEQENETLRARLRRLPPLARTGLRDCQYEAITNLERSFADNRPRALIQMATGSGKTYTAVASIYRLLKFGGARRVLFLVDRANLGRQALNEFLQYVTPDSKRRFGELYNVQLLTHNAIDRAANVCITTIQRLYSILSGEPELEGEQEERSLFDREEELLKERPKQVRYNPAVPVETFDVIFVDECHRSIYHVWRAVLEYFDAFIVGLTATPNKQTFGFFHRNLVMEYGHERAVADGVNVDYGIFRLRTDISERGSRIEPLSVVGLRDRRTRAVRWEQLEDELVYYPEQLDREVVSLDQIRTIIRAYRDSYRQLFPERTKVPKTLIFAKDDSHADTIVEIAREEFMPEILREGCSANDYVRKITYRTTGARPEDLITAFRNRLTPRIVVTVDMIATGTDIKPLEVLIFMRPVRSRGFYEQMLGRGSRTIDETEFQRVMGEEVGKTRFVVIDAVGVSERVMIDSGPLERKSGLSLEKLLQDVALGKWRNDPDLLRSLAGRLGRLARRATPEQQAAVMAASGGLDLRALARRIVEALDPDVQLERAMAETGQSLLMPEAPEVQAVRLRLLQEAAAPFDQPELRQALLRLQGSREQVLDEVSQDRVIEAGWQATTVEDDQEVLARLRRFIEECAQEQPILRRLWLGEAGEPWREADLKRLTEALAAPPWQLSLPRLVQAYARLEPGRVPGQFGSLETDLIALLRYTIERERAGEAVLVPYRTLAEHRFAAWLAEEEERRGAPFTREQRLWLEAIRDAIATSLSIELTDFEMAPFHQLGGLGRAISLFGADLPAILRSLNERLAS